MKRCSPDTLRKPVAPARGRGLKFDIFYRDKKDFCRPRKGAWIEITLASPTLSRISRRPRKGAWIEILLLCQR